MNKVAVIQKAPAFMDKERTVAMAVECIDTAVQNGAELIVFSEAFIPGYPAWIWRLRPGNDWNTSEALHQLLVRNSVDLNSDDLQPVCQAARKHRVTISCGIVERDAGLSRTTLYNTLITIGPDGSLTNVHRKLMPTNPERMVWGFGDAAGLKVQGTPVGRIGGLICWENYMPLARYALYAQGIELYIAPTYDSGPGWIGTLQHIAREGRCYVIGCGHLLQGKHIPADFPEKGELYPDNEEWINPGDSAVVAPGGELIAGPLSREEGILYADLDREKVTAARRSLDVAGHYARPDIFNLSVNTQPQTPIKFE